MNVSIQTILVPVDGSEHSQRALATGLALAERLGASVTVLEVIEEYGPLPSYYEQPPEGETREHWLSEERFEPMRKLLEATSVPWDRRVEEGTPPNVICEVAEQGDYDMIVIGRRGMSSVGRWLVGSVSDRVVRHAPCTVTVVR